MSLASTYRRYAAYRADHRWLKWAEDLFLFAVLIGGVMMWQTRGLVPSGAEVPNFQLTDLSGRTWTSEELKGKNVVVYFWAPWCSVCKANSSAVSGLAKSVADDKDAAVVSIALAYDDVADVRAYAEKHEVKYPVLLGNDELMRAFRVDSFPTTYFLSKDGRIKHAAVGYTSGLGLRWRLWF